MDLPLALMATCSYVANELQLPKFTHSHIPENKGSVTMVNDKLLVEQSF